MPASFDRNERRLLYGVACASLLALSALIWLLGRPVYWYLLAEVFQPFRSEPVRHDTLPAFLRDVESAGANMGPRERAACPSQSACGGAVLVRSLTGPPCLC